jgi:hypothetical protein
MSSTDPFCPELCKQKKPRNQHIADMTVLTLRQWKRPGTHSSLSEMCGVRRETCNMKPGWQNEELKVLRKNQI